jgi:hypothetical protein
MATTTYRYLFADLVTNQILAELPLTGVTYNQQLNTAGSFQGHLLLSGVNATGLNISAATIPSKTAVYVDRNGVLVWGGVIWSREYKSSNQTLSITAREFISYFERRRISNTTVFNSVDQLQIAQTLISNAQGVPYGNIGILYNQDSSSTSTSGVLISRTYYNYEIKPVFVAVQDLSKQTNGFDFGVSVYYDGSGNPSRSFNTYYPRRGTIYSSSNPSAPVFEFPAGNIAEYTYPEDGIAAANTIYALGAGSNEGKLIAISQNASYLTTGWALLEDQANYSDITDSAVLANLAIGQINAVSYPPTTLKVIAPPYVSPTFGTYQLGDDIRIRITDNRFPNTLDAVYRLTNIDVIAGEDGPERVTLTLVIGTTGSGV